MWALIPFPAEATDYIATGVTNAGKETKQQTTKENDDGL